MHPKGLGRLRAIDTSHRRDELFEFIRTSMAHGSIRLYAAIVGWRPLILRVGTVVDVMPQPRSRRR
jgi:hypothetical protein